MTSRDYDVTKIWAEYASENDIIGINSEHFSGNDISLLLGRVSRIGEESESSHIRIALNPYLYLSNEMQREDISPWNAIYFVASCPRTDSTTEFVAEMHVHDLISRYSLREQVPQLIHPDELRAYENFLIGDAESFEMVARTAKEKNISSDRVSDLK